MKIRQVFYETERCRMMKDKSRGYAKPKFATPSVELSVDRLSLSSLSLSSTGCTGELNSANDSVLGVHKLKTFEMEVANSE